jgi:hypothetical protein
MERFSFIVDFGRINSAIRSLFRQITNQLPINRLNSDETGQISLGLAMSGSLVLYEDSGPVDRKRDTARFCCSVSQLVQPFCDGTSTRQIVQSRFNVEKLLFTNPLISIPSRASPVNWSQ